MISAVSFEIIIQRAVGNEPCYLIKKKTYLNYMCFCNGEKIIFILCQTNRNSLNSVSSVILLFSTRT
jgi:hypothetical protein